MPRGRPPAHTRDQVVDAAVAVADTSGLEAVTMRRVAAEIGAGAMSLYTYVPDRDRLIDLMVDRVAGTVDHPARTGDWVGDTCALLAAQRALMLRHPWLPAALPDRRLTGRNTLAYLEAGLAALEPAGLDGPAAMEVIALLTGFVATFVTGETASRVSTGEQVALIGEAVASGDFPRLAAVLAGPAAAAPDFGRIARLMVTGLVAPG